MVSAEGIAAVVFLVALSIFLYVKRKNIVFNKIIGPVVYFAMYKAKWGLDLMDSWAKKMPRFLRVLGYIGIVVGFLGMILISGSLIYTLIKAFVVKETAAGVGLVLPIKAKGVFYVPFFYWIISIFIIAVVHEFAHGVIARANNLKVKSSGFAFLGIVIPILPAAFVEPDEQELKKAPKHKQLMVFAAGPFSNILLALLTVGIIAVVFAPIADAMIDPTGVRIDSLQEDFPAHIAGVPPGSLITAVNGEDVTTTDEFIQVMSDKKPDDTVLLATNESEHNVTLTANPADKDKGYLGVFISQHAEISPGFEDKYGAWLPPVILWLIGLLEWLYILNIGIGLFNLLPLGPIDGGRMLHTGLQYITSEKRAGSIWKNVSIFFLFVILINISFGFF